MHFSTLAVLEFSRVTSALSCMIASCVMPVLLYGSENWILTETLMKKLEAFQGELVRGF